MLAFLSSISVNSQNLVKNPSFEQYNICPDEDSSDSKPINWESYSTSKYVNSCALDSFFSVPRNRFTFQAAKEGFGYTVGIAAHRGNNQVTYNRGEFIQALKRDSVYCVSYYICATDDQHKSIRNIDAYISKSPTANWNQITNKVLSQYTPQIRSYSIWNDTLNWTKVSQLYKALGGERYITIGNFNDNEYTIKNDKLIYYLIDLVSVSPVHLEAPLGRDITVCPTDFPYTLKAPTNYDSYSWGADSLVIYGMGVYGLTCYLDDCGFLYDEIDVGLKIVTPLSLIEDTTICKGEAIKLEAQSGFDSYLWNTGDTTKSIRVNQAGMYSVEVERFCGVQKDSVIILIDSVPNVSLTIGNDTNICRNEDENIPIKLNPSIQLPNYLWSTGETSSSIMVAKGGGYWLESSYSCGILRSNKIEVTACTPKEDIIFIPNAFSPNNDGLNDVFKPVVNDANLVELTIYNRWGEEIYSDMDRFEWDGLCGIKVCTKGMYIFVVLFKDETGNVLQRKGKFQLVN